MSVGWARTRAQGLEVEVEVEVSGVGGSFPSPNQCRDVPQWLRHHLTLLVTERDHIQISGGGRQQQQRGNEGKLMGETRDETTDLRLLVVVRWPEAREVSAPTPAKQGRTLELRGPGRQHPWAQRGQAWCRESQLAGQARSA